MTFTKEKYFFLMNFAIFSAMIEEEPDNAVNEFAMKVVKNNEKLAFYLVSTLPHMAER